MDRGYIYVNKNNIQHNIDYLNNLTGSELCIVVKANAYGHGIDWTVNTAIESGVGWFAVAAIDEAILVRSISDNIRILLLSEPSISELEKLATYNIDTTVYNESFIEALGESQHSFKVHLKIDTGMHRVGCSPDKFDTLYEKISSFDNLALEGICTHFPVADTDEIQTNHSIKMFKDTISNIDINSYDNNITCYGDTAAFAAVLNPNPLFEYNWFVNGELFSNGSESDLIGGSITLIANYLQCSTISDELIINQPTQTQLLSNIVDVSCYGDTSGSISVQVIDQQGVELNWLNGLEVNDLNNLSAGNYELLVTNAAVSYTHLTLPTILLV